jgi:uncharacterized BrkB/YihY/UPF0761 family membrane protein
LANAAIQAAAAARARDDVAVRRSTSRVDLLPGCALFGLAVAVLHAVSRVYLPRELEQSSQLYGSLGVAAVILGWLLIIGQIIVSAALLNSVWTEYRERRRAAPTAQ